MTRKLRKHRLMRILARGRVLIHPQDAGCGQKPGQLLLDTLRAEAAVVQLAAALRAGLGQRLHRMAAMMAEQRLLRLVVNERHAAVGAFQHMAAGGTHADGTVAAAVQQQDALLAVIQIFLQLAGEADTDFARVARSQLSPHINKIHMGQRPSTVAMAQLDKLQTAAFCGIVSFSLRRGGGKQKQCVFHHGAFFGHIVGIIARGRLTLIGVLLLLVHDDKAEILQRCKDGAAGAYYDVGIALLDHAPLQKPLGIVERRVLHGQAAAEGGFETADHLRCQADFRHQHQRSAAQRKRALDQTQEYDGLAAAGHAMQKRRMGLVILKAGQQLLKHLLLLCGKGKRLWVKGDCSKQIKGLVLLDGRQNSFFDKTVQRCPGNPHFVQLPGGQRTVFQCLDRRQLAWAGLWFFRQCTSQCVELFGGAGQPALHDRVSVGHRGPVLRPIGNDSLDGLKPGAEGALLQKANQFQQVGRQTGLLGRGIVQGFQPLGGISLLHFLHRQHDRHPSLIPPAERHQYHAAGVNLADKLCRDEVGIQSVKMDIGVIYSRPGKQQTHSSLPCCSLNWMME